MMAQSHQLGIQPSDLIPNGVDLIPNGELSGKRGLRVSFLYFSLVRYVYDQELISSWYDVPVPFSDVN